MHFIDREGVAVPDRYNVKKEGVIMSKAIILWFVGVPISVIILLKIFGII
jgi:hypothetical protein